MSTMSKRQRFRHAQQLIELLDAFYRCAGDHNAARVNDLVADQSVHFFRVFCLGDVAVCIAVKVSAGTGSWSSLCRRR